MLNYLDVCACAKCGETKPLDAFHRNAGKPNGRHSWCRPCANAGRKASRDRNGRAPNKRAYNLTTRYRMTEAQEREMYEAQGGLCGICRASLLRHHIDHDHKTGKVRGLLCARCNLGVGHLERDGFVEAAMAYLRSHGGAQ